MLQILMGLSLITLVAGTENCTIGTSVPAGDGCNTCVCMDNGTLANCTHKKCKAELREINENKVSEENKIICTPGKPFIPDGDCNYCTCSADGQNALGCSTMSCFRIRSVKDEPCILRRTFNSKDNCNKCQCNRQRLALCTRKTCAK